MMRLTILKVKYFFRRTIVLMECGSNEFNGCILKK